MINQQYKEARHVQESLKDFELNLLKNDMDLDEPDQDDNLNFDNISMNVIGNEESYQM